MKTTSKVKSLVKESKSSDKSSVLGKRTKKERPVIDLEYESDHDEAWKRQNMLAIEDEDKEIKELERKLGLRTDEKRKKRYLQRIEEEGLGLGIFDFLKDIETKAKMDVSQYKRADQEYKFNDP